MTATDDLLDNARRYAAGFTCGDLGRAPARRVAVVTCMDARIDPARLLGLTEGDAHVIRNAGGVVTPDVIRSLAASQWLLATEEVVLIQHTDCGVLTSSDTAFREQVRRETGHEIAPGVEPSGDVDTDVARSIAAVRSSAVLPHRDGVRGFVYDVGDGSLREVRPH
ncbi:MAG TPA: carbonic anhydrase [Acidimicrobiales bacterium]|nr:carbonic anhydrase [Acidimicrobiales bacterium]